MDDILKYHRIQGRIQEILRSDKITCSRLENSTLLLGTEGGLIHIVNLGWTSIKSIRVHDRAINDISTDSNCINIASCSDNGTVVVYTPNSEEVKEHTVHFNEPLKAVCVEEEAGSRKERSFIVGTSSGQLIYHKTAWFAPKNVVLYSGSGSAVTSITWKGVVVAWSDLSQVRLLDISTQSALCYLDCPVGVSLQCPIPCRLYWESNQDLWVAWADNVRHLELRLGSDGVEINVKSAHDWQADCIVCGLSTFDADHLILLGYVPPEDDSLDMVMASPSTNRNSLLRIDEESSLLQQPSLSLDDDLEDAPTKPVNCPEMQLVQRHTGKVISADVLPMRGELIMNGPWGYQLLCSYQDRSNGNDSKQWSLTEMNATRGGFRNLSPINYVLSPQDIVVARVRDVNDRICIALMQSDLVTAANLAVSDAYSLTHYKSHDLVSLYLEDLLDQENFEFAASECARLIGKNVGLWELWICTFIRHRCIIKLLPYIPTRDPVLSMSYYEMVIADFIREKETNNLFAAVELWVNVHPPIFDHAQLLSRLEANRDPDTWILETQGKLLIQAGKFEDAVKTYLSIRYPRREQPQAASNSVAASGGIGSSAQLSPLLASQADEAAALSNPYYHVFELIDKYDLFSVVKDKIINLVRLSRELAGNMLVRCVDKLLVSVVARQLRSDRQLLHWYLNLLFTRIPEQYNVQEFAEYHVMQVTLYSEFAPKFVKPAKKSYTADASAFDDATAMIMPTSTVVESDFLKFLKTSNFAPLEMALKECEKRRPPLFPEIIYILSRTEHHQDALGLLLKEIGDVQQAVAFVETHSHLQQQLSSDLIEYSLKHQDFLTDLLNYVGISSLNPKEVVSRIPRKVVIPLLRQKLLRIINQYNFQVFLNDKSNSILACDTLTLLRQLNQGQRRAIKVEPNLRCAVCARPLFMAPAQRSSAMNPDGANFASGDSFSSSSLHDASRLGLDGQIWGNQALGATGGGVVVFSTKLASHRYCLESVKLGSVHTGL